MRSGQATAAPVAHGKPWPIAPPVLWIQSWGAALNVAGKIRTARCHRVIGDDRILGEQRCKRHPEGFRLKGPLTISGSAPSFLLVRREARRSRRQALAKRPRRLAPAAQHVHCTILRRHEAGLSGIGEESRRWLRADEDRVLEPGKSLEGGVEYVRNAIHRHPARPRAIRGTCVGARSFAPVAWAIRWAAMRPASLRAWPLRNKMVGLPERMTRATVLSTSGATCCRGETQAAQPGRLPRSRQHRPARSASQSAWRGARSLYGRGGVGGNLLRKSRSS